MQPTYTIRRARADEWAAAGELTMAAYMQYAEIMAPEAWPGLHNALTTALAGLQPENHFVAEQDGALIGSVLLFPASGGNTGSGGGRMIWPELRLLAVAPAARGQGIGQALIQACIAQARAEGAPAIGLYSSDSMRAAIAIYEQFGFTRMPTYDFQPPGAELIKAFKLEL